MTQKTIVILGPTASGKSAVGIALARKIGGEIVSADSRQVYRGMDIGTGKVSKKEQRMIPHHMLDVVTPKRQYTVSQFKSAAIKSMKEIRARGKIPIIVGGTAFYIYAVIDDLSLPTAKPDLKLRKSLANKSAAQLFKVLQKLDPRRAKGIDRHNPRRLIRAIEIVKATGQPVPELVRKPDPNVLMLGIRTQQKKLYAAIDKRVDQRLKAGMVNEVRKLIKGGLSHKKLQGFGLEYKHVSMYLQGKVPLAQMTQELKNAIHRFSKRQMTWFKRDERVNWISTPAQLEKLARNFTK